MDCTFTERELEVAEILRRLPELLRENDRMRPPRQRSASLQPLRWGCKKMRRSSANQHRTHNPSSPPPKPNPPTTTAAAAASSLEPAPPVASRSSPASTLSFSPTAEEDPDHNPNVASSVVAVIAGSASSSSSSPLTVPCKNAKMKSKEWMEEQNNVISFLRQQNQSMQQVATDLRVKYEVLLAENSRLKEMRSKLEMEQRGRDPRHRHQQVQHAHSETSTYPSTVGPAGPIAIHSPDRHHCRDHHRLLLHHHQQQQQEEEEVAMAPPRYAPHQRSSVGIPPRPSHPQYWRPAGGCGAVPGVNDPFRQRHCVVAVAELHQPPRGHMDDAMRKATTEARRKRIEIKRRKAEAAETALVPVCMDGGGGVVEVAAAAER